MAFITLGEGERIQTPEPNTIVGSGGIDTNQPISRLNSRIDQMNLVVLTVVVILLVMVATLLIDSFHFNSATYREYSEKLEILESLRKQEEYLQRQYLENQTILMKQQEEILNRFPSQVTQP